MDTKTVSSDNQVIAHVFYHNIRAEGVKFLTPDTYTLQLGLIEHKAGKIIRDHIHRQDIKYKVDTTQEFLYIESGKVLIKLFNLKWEEIEQLVLTKGDFILFVGGGHGLEIIDNSRIIEIKQGPYPGDINAKTYKEDSLKYDSSK